MAPRSQEWLHRYVCTHMESLLYNVHVYETHDLRHFMDGIRACEISIVLLILKDIYPMPSSSWQYHLVPTYESLEQAILSFVLAFYLIYDVRLR